MTQVTKPILLDETGVIIAEKLQHIANAIDPEGGGGELDELSERVAIIEGKEAGWDAKANKDGYYSQMGVGVADNLAGKGDGVPAEFTRRPTGGTADVADGVATFKSIEGNTIVWNQLIKVSSVGSSTKSGITITRNSDNSVVLNGEATASSGFDYAPFGYDLIPSSHIVLIACIPVSGTFSAANNNAKFWDGYPSSGFALLLSGGKKIVTARTSMSLNTPFYGLTNISVGDTFDNYTLKFEMFDLTQMFGAGNEPTTVAEFEALFPEAYYPYNEGQLLSLNMTGIKTDGFNQWDEQWESGYKWTASGKILSAGQYCVKNAIKVFPSTNYYFYSSASVYREIYFYDGDMNYISSMAFTSGGKVIATPDNCHYIAWNNFGNTFEGTKSCINLSHSGVRDGEYEPYEQHTRPLDVTKITSGGNVIFPDGMKSAGTAHDELTGVVGGALTKAIRRIGVVDLGSLIWTYSEFGGYVRVNASLDGVKSDNLVPNVVCVRGYYGNSKPLSTNTLNLAIAYYGGRFYLRDDSFSGFTDAQVKQALAGVILLYELAEPIEYIIDEADVPNYNYKVSDFGTETLLPEGVDEQGVPKTSPIKAQIVYGMNAVDFIRNAPKNYISKESMDAILTAFKTAGIISAYTLTWDATNGKYNCTITPNA